MAGVARALSTPEIEHVLRKTGTGAPRILALYL